MADDRIPNGLETAQKVLNKTSPEDRRDVLKKFGRLALYTAPAMLIAFESPKAQAISPPPQ